MDENKANIAALLSQMSHADLYNLRGKPGTDQDFVAPYEHRAFAREATRENPWLAAPIATAIPLYELAKILGVTNARSAPSLEAMKQGYAGIWEGLK